MESSSCKPIIKTSDAEIQLEETCRLRHNLNSDCLLKILQYLDLQDLIQLSKLDTYFYNLIASEIIAKKVIDLGAGYVTIEAFEMFGKFMKKIVIGGDDFNGFLAMITTYCRPNRLTEIGLKFASNTSSLHLIDESMPFFLKVRKLSLYDATSRGLYQHFLTKLCQESKSIEILQLQKIDVVGGWLQNNQNLDTFMLHETINISMDDLTSCFKVNPKLKVFEYRGVHDLTQAYQTLAVCCPGLQTFSDCHFSNPYDSFGRELMRRYDFLTQLKQLDSVTLTAYTECGHDLNHPLNIPALAKISKFKVFMDRNRFFLGEERKTQIMKSSPSLNDLKTVEIEIRSHEVDCNLRCEFISNFISQSRSVENIKLVGYAVTNAISILQNAKNIRRLSIGETHFEWDQQSQQLRKITRDLLLSSKSPSVGEVIRKAITSKLT